MEGIKEVVSKRFKARLIVSGFTKKEGVEFNIVFLPVVKKKSIRMFLALAEKFDLELEKIYVISSFLYGDLDETISMR